VFLLYVFKLQECCSCVAGRCCVDLPSILSGDYLGILDPHQQFFDASGSHAWTLCRDGPSLLSSARHQLDPYLGMFGCSQDTFSSTPFHYPGTLFRFPLRTTPSALSDTVCHVAVIYFISFLRAKAATAFAILSVRLSVCHTGGSVKTVQDRIIKFSPLAAWKTLVSGTVKLFHKFVGGHPERRH